MRDYTNEEPTFFNTIRVTEPDDPDHADIINEAPIQVFQNTLVNAEMIKKLEKKMGADEYDSEKSYKSGSYCLNNGILYKCIQNTTGEWNTESWKQTNTFEEISIIQKRLDEVFQIGSENKGQLVENLTALGITASANETWETLLDKVLLLMNTSNDTVTAEVLLNGYTAHNAAGKKITGTLADKTDTTDHSADASLDITNKRLKLKVPVLGKYGTSNYLYAAFSIIANLIGLTAAKLVKGNTILGITGNDNNMDTSGADAAAGNILSGKKAAVKGALITGLMPNKGAWTGATTGSGNVPIPEGYHNGQGHVSGQGAYNKGVTDADNRANPNSVNYKSGYNAGVNAADGRVNADSANYKGGYNAGVSATKKGTAGAGDVLFGKTFTNNSSVGAGGTMPNKGAWTGNTTGSGNVPIPEGYHNGQGHVSGQGAYNKGVTDADNRANPNSANYKSGYNAGVSAADGRVNANSANYKGGYNAGVSATKKGTAGAGDVLSGKTFTNSSSVEASGTMANKGNTTQDATVTQDNDYTYLAIPANGYYDTNSKLRTKNSNLNFHIGTEQAVKKNTAFAVEAGKYYLFVIASTGWTSTMSPGITGGTLITFIKHSILVTGATYATGVAAIIKATSTTMSIEHVGKIIPIT